jgi:hypothetical protein
MPKKLEEKRLTEKAPYKFAGLRSIAQRGSGKSAWTLNGNAGRRRKNPSKKRDPRRV